MFARDLAASFRISRHDDCKREPRSGRDEGRVKTGTGESVADQSDAKAQLDFISTSS